MKAANRRSSNLHRSGRLNWIALKSFHVNTGRNPRLPVSELIAATTVSILSVPTCVENKHIRKIDWLPASSPGWFHLCDIGPLWIVESENEYEHSVFDSHGNVRSSPDRFVHDRRDLRRRTCYGMVELARAGTKWNIARNGLAGDMDAGWGQ